MSQARRVPVRNCIRKDTFRYLLDPYSFANSWQRLEQVFGSSQEFGSPQLLQIETKDFLIRSSKQNATMTLIKKQECQEEAIAEFHRIIHFLEEAA